MTILREVAQASSPYPIVDLEQPMVPHSGLVYATPRFCAKVFPSGKCAAFYEVLASQPQAGVRHRCPYGFAVWPMKLGDATLAITSLVAAPRVGSSDERLRAKESPGSRTDAATVERWLGRMTALVRDGDQAREEEFSRRLEALHEIRRLNQIVKTNMERVCTRESPGDPDAAPPDLVRAFRASSLLSFQLDALDLLANPDTAMTFKPRKWVFYRKVDSIVRIYRVLAGGRDVVLRFSGTSTAEALVDDRTIHIIPSALIDNAIKYSPARGTVDVWVGDEVRNNRRVVTLQVRSEGPLATGDEERNLFRRRGRGAAARAVAEGSGVGLTLAKVVADQHHGHLEARQREITRTKSEWTFRFQIPAI